MTDLFGSTPPPDPTPEQYAAPHDVASWLVCLALVPNGATPHYVERVTLLTPRPIPTHAAAAERAAHYNRGYASAGVPRHVFAFRATTADLRSLLAGNADPYDVVAEGFAGLYHGLGLAAPRIRP